MFKIVCRCAPCNPFQGHVSWHLCQSGVCSFEIRIERAVLSAEVVKDVTAPEKKGQTSLVGASLSKPLYNDHNVGTLCAAS